MTVKGVRAAQYIRMSTDMQQYSIANQAAAIAQYADQHGLKIVRGYEDAGKSGLVLAGREALRNLIEDVTSGRADFDVILVYDVSRWGRFQDCDESAHYEFICKKAGVSIRYCAEQFENDGSLLATLVKNLKRAMAGEFSRELSVKVHAGQSRLAARGFRFGALPGYALRRMLIDENGAHKQILGAGDRKSLRSEHTILVPGPPEEVAVVRYVYDEFIDKQRSMTDIARDLNERGIPNSVGTRWSNLNIRELLTHEKYMGTNVYNRTSRKLGGKARRNPHRDWVRKLDAFQPIVAPRRFDQAQRRLKTIAYHFTERDMFDYLTSLWCKRGCLSRAVIDGASTGPSTHSYKNRFGSLTNAFRLVGFRTHRLASRDNLRRIRDDLCAQITAGVICRGAKVRRPTGHNCMLRVNDELNVLVVIGRTSPSNIARHQNQWRFGYRCKKKPDLLVVARVENDSSRVRDFYLLPFLFFPHGTWLTVSGLNYQRLEPFRSSSLEPLFELCARKPLDGNSAWPTDAN